jgi:hypothetical protein
MTSSDEVIDRSASAIAADPHFDAAVVSYVEAMVAWRRGLGNFNKVVSCGARQRIMKSVLRLHYSNAGDNPDDGATFERLLALANPGDGGETCGPRVLRTVIALAQRTGHLHVAKGWFDRRLKILRPTEKWITQEAERHEGALASLRLLQRDRTRFLSLPCGVNLVARLATAAQFDSACGLTLGTANGGLHAIAALDGGMATVFAVAEACLRDKRIPSHKELGASFRLSASQARKILRLAAEHELLVFNGLGKISDASGLLSETRRLIAHELALYAQCVAPARPQNAEIVLPMAAKAKSNAEHAN